MRNHSLFIILIVTIDSNITTRYNVTISRNKGYVMNYISEIAKSLKKLKTETDVYNFLLEILTESEVETLSKRWCILKMLKRGKTQREIAKELGVSLCKVTRGAKILKNPKSVIIKNL